VLYCGAAFSNADLGRFLPKLWRRFGVAIFLWALSLKGLSHPVNETKSACALLRYLGFPFGWVLRCNHARPFAFG
jgi:hypothetical protein